jgi:hypothetical protein
MNRLSPVALAALLAVTAACSSSGSPIKSRSTTATPSSSTAAPTSAGATVRQWGSLVAEKSTPVVAESQKRAACPILDDPSSTDVTCSLGRLTFEFTVETFGISFDTGAKSLGSPPSEIASLVAQTSSVVQAMKHADDAYRAACVGNGSGPSNQDACNQAQLAWSTAKGDVDAMINAWKPYTG